MKKKLQYTLFGIALVTTSILSACSKMNDTYKDFIKEGMITYIGSASSVQVKPGRNRLLLTFPTPTDPKAVKAKIYWDNRANFVEVPIERGTTGMDTVKVPLNDLSERSYTFEIFTFDNKGNSSIKVEMTGRVYGDLYEATLLSRPIDKYLMADDNSLTLDWGAASDTTVIGSEVVYKDASGIQKTLFVPVKDVSTIIPDFVPQTMKHRTLYLPTKLAIDTFYTAYVPQRIKGKPIDVNKTGWTITASSQDPARPAINLIDNNVTNLFVNQITSTNNYPHFAIVNMGRVISDIEGFYFYQRSINPVKTLEIQISQDGITWTSLGDFTLANSPVVNTSNPQAAVPVYASLATPMSFKYFKQIYKNDYGNSKNVNLHEIGVYTR